MLKKYFILLFFLFTSIFCSNNTDVDEILDSYELMNYIYEKTKDGWIIYDSSIVVNNTKYLCWKSTSNDNDFFIYNAIEISHINTATHKSNPSYKDQKFEIYYYNHEKICTNDIIEGIVLSQYYDNRCTKLIQWPILYDVENLPQYLLVENEMFTYQSKSLYSQITTTNSLDVCTFHNGNYIKVSYRNNTSNKEFMMNLLIDGIFILMLLIPMLIFKEKYIIHVTVSSIVGTIIVYIISNIYYYISLLNFSHCALNSTKLPADICYHPKEMMLLGPYSPLYKFVHGNIYVLIIIMIIHISITLMVRKRLVKKEAKSKNE